MYISDGKPSSVINGEIGAGGVAKGDLCVISSSTYVKAAAAPTAGTVVAVALKSGSSGATGLFELVGDRRVTAKYIGSTKTSLTDDDLGKTFDISDAQTVNLDDTTGGCCFCVGYNNTNKTIDFVVTETAKIA